MTGCPCWALCWGQHDQACARRCYVACYPVYPAITEGGRLNTLTRRVRAHTVFAPPVNHSPRALLQAKALSLPLLRLFRARQDLYPSALPTVHLARLL